MAQIDNMQYVLWDVEEIQAHSDEAYIQIWRFSHSSHAVEIND